MALYAVRALRDETGRRPDVDRWAAALSRRPGLLTGIKTVDFVHVFPEERRTGRPAPIRCWTRRALRGTWFRAPDKAKRIDGRRRRMSRGQKRGKVRRTPPMGDGVKGGLNGNGAGDSMMTKKILHGKVIKDS